MRRIFRSTTPLLSLLLAVLISTFFVKPKVEASNDIYPSPKQPLPYNIREERSNILSYPLTTPKSTPDKGIYLRNVPEEEQTRFIIQLKGDPISVINQRFGNTFSISSYSNLLQLRQASLVNKIMQRYPESEVIHSYTFLFNGIAISTKTSHYQEIANMPEVESVFVDFQVNTTLNESTSLVGAPQVWNLNDHSGQPVRGRGIRVAVIDTGIDYTHPDLGGCFGAGCKVAGGYDFYNNDNDPFDDNGHGTHVAGIIAANGSIRGVAPEATLLAYKALGSGGSGWASTIIAALEAAVDPDNNPLTNDGAHVINMSLGGGGNPDSPLSQAVDRAVQQGSIVVVAAGNEGNYGQDGYATIGSPASARRALTVAASSKTDTRANFSSRGPVAGFWEVIKPDLIAPGVSILSTIPGNGYQAYSGTSMAAPHVAGAAALLRQIYPGWEADAIKALLMNNTLDLGLDVFSQGVGRLQIDRAATASTLIQPASLSFGMSDLDQPIWQSQRVITVTNLSSNPSNYVLSATAPSSPGIYLDISPSTFTLTGGSSRQVTITLRVENDRVPFINHPTFAYSGTILINDGHTTWRTPYVFFKTHLLELTFANGVPSVIIVHDRNSYEREYVRSLDFSYDQSILKIYLPEGIYDIVVFYDYFVRPGWNVYESIKVHEKTIQVIDRNNMDKEIRMRAFDHQNRVIPLDNQLTSDSIQISFSDKRNSLGIISAYSCTEECPPTIYTSSFSDYYQVDAIIPVRVFQEGQLHYYNITYHITDGLNSSTTLRNNPSEFRSLRLDFQVEMYEDGIIKISPLFWQSLSQCRGWMAFSSIITNWAKLLNFVDRIYIHLTPTNFATQCPNNIDFATSFVVARSPEIKDWLYLSSPLFVPHGDDRIRQGYFFALNNDILPLHTLPNIVQENLLIGDGPLHWAGRLTTDNNSYWLEAAYVPRLGDLRWWFIPRWYVLDQGMSSVTTPVTVTVELDGAVVEQGVLKYGWTFDGSLKFQVSPGDLKATFMHQGYHVGGRTGRGVAIYRTDFGRSDNQPPYLVTLNVMNGAFMSGRVSRSGVVRFSVGDDSGVSSVRLFLREQGGLWREMPLRNDGAFYEAALSSFTDSLQPSFIDLRIEVEDLARNQFSYTLEPAFILQQLIPPSISSADRAIFVIGRYGSFSFTATGHPQPRISITGRLPEGLVFDESTATIHGSPSPGTAGVYPLTVTARNNVDPDAVQNFTLTVNAPIFLPLVIR